MDQYLFVKTLHIISSTVLFGTGIGIAWFMLCSFFSDNLREKYFAAKFTVLADYLFTTPAIIIQPVSGFWLISISATHWNAGWLLATYIIYAIAAACWLPVVWIQIRLKTILSECIESGSELPPEYKVLFKTWFFLGWPAFIGLIIVFYLMVAKPA